MSKDLTEKEREFRVDTMDILSHLYDMYDDKEESARLLISALATQLVEMHDVTGAENLDVVCERIKAQLKDDVRMFLEEKN